MSKRTTRHHKVLEHDVLVGIFDVSEATTNRNVILLCIACLREFTVS